MITFEIGAVLVILVIAVVLFATEKLPVDLVALLIMALLIVLGIVTPEQGVSGFSNSATITVASMFILSSALFRSGAVVKLGLLMAGLFKYSFWLGIFCLMIVVGIVSAFINNTPVVAIFIPILASAAAKNNMPLAKMLMPLSFASMFGGVCTLIGTSTNILVSGIAAEHGLEPFGMFEMSKLGIIFFVAGIAYMMLVGIHLIPKRKSETDLVMKFGMGEYLTEIVLMENAPSVGKAIKDSPLNKKLEIDIFEIKRYGQKFFMPSDTMVLEKGDVLKVRCNVEKIRTLQEREGIELKSNLKMQNDIESEDSILIEAVIAPNSDFEGKTIKQIDFKNSYGAIVLAIRHRGEVMRENVANTVLRAGDTLLIEAQTEQFYYLKQLELKGKNTFLIVTQVGLPKFKKEKIFTVVFTMLSIIVLASLNILPIMVAALLGCVFLVISGSISMEEAYQAIDWKVIFLLAGAMSLGVAMDESGTANMISLKLVSFAGDLGPVVIVSALFIITSFLTGIMSNNASAVLLTPIAIATAVSMDVDARPFLMAITFAASSSFMTPVGYQTNTMIYGAGNYRFADFLKVGTPLNIIFWIIATFMIPILFPF
ncbi:MAG: SLC13 family permease [Bacteroidota bacterium]